MSNPELTSRVSSVLSATINNPAVDENSDIHNTDGWDSMAFMNVVIALEKEFQTRFSALEIASMQSVTKIVSVLEKRVGN